MRDIVCPLANSIFVCFCLQFLNRSSERALELYSCNSTSVQQYTSLNQVKLNRGNNIMLLRCGLVIRHIVIAEVRNDWQYLFCIHLKLKVIKF